MARTWAAIYRESTWNGTACTNTKMTPSKVLRLPADQILLAAAVSDIEAGRGPQPRNGPIPTFVRLLRDTMPSVIEVVELDGHGSCSSRQAPLNSPSRTPALDAPT